MKRLVIRSMTPDDLRPVVAIEQTVFSTPWSLMAFREGLEPGASVSWTAELSGRVAGYLISWVEEDELHIGNLAVAPVYRQRGIARRLVEHSLTDAVERGLRWAALEVRRSNEKAMELYGSLGFRRVGIRRRYYVDDGEDAIVMALELSGERS
jgi:ribosomal-protein-alanine N-acetyltransferase